MRWSFESSDASGAYHVRDDLIAYLEVYATPDSDLAGAALIFGELVGNVVRHAPGPIAVRLRWEHDIAVLAVRDFGPGFDWKRASLPDPLAEGGRGLFIVQAVAGSITVRRCAPNGAEAIALLPVRLQRPA